MTQWQRECSAVASAVTGVAQQLRRFRYVNQQLRNSWLRNSSHSQLRNSSYSSEELRASCETHLSRGRADSECADQKYFTGTMCLRCRERARSAPFASGGCNLTLRLGVPKFDVSLRHIRREKLVVWSSHASKTGCDRGDGQRGLTKRTRAQRSMNSPFVPPSPFRLVVLIATCRGAREKLASIDGLPSDAPSDALWNPLAKDFLGFSPARKSRSTAL